MENNIIAGADLDDSADSPVAPEAIDSSNSDSDLHSDDDDIGNEGQTFDRSLPVQHSYLGSNLTLLQGRTLLDEGSVHWLPILPQTDIVLMPGQTLPLSVLHPSTINMLHRCIDKDRIFGGVCMEQTHLYSGEVLLADVGTTAEIYESHMEDDASSMQIKAIGRQRFKIMGIKQDPEGFTVAQVQILPEIVLPNPMAEIRLHAVDRYRTSGLNDEAHHKKTSLFRKRDSVTSVWPSWVYSQFDTDHLVQKMARELSLLNLGSKVPTDPVELSFWVARSLPIKDKDRLDLLRMNSAILRLQEELKTLNNISVLRCKYCDQQIANQRDVFLMSAEGLQGAYCNEYGYVYETITIHKAKGLSLWGDIPKTEYSWFPGYGWTIAECSRCKKHMGWLFTATNADLKPARFWGLCRRSLSAILKKANE